eukprot:15346028-Ditylum_brightwellii.AAC.1
MVLNAKLIYRWEGGLSILTLAWRLGVFPPSIARDLFFQQSSPAHQDIPPRLTSTLFSNENHQSNDLVLEGAQSMINVAASGYMLNPVQEVATCGSPDMMHVQ